MPVVETIAVKRGGAQALIERVDGEMPVAASATVGDDPAAADLHAQVRDMLAATVPCRARPQRRRRARSLGTASGVWSVDTRVVMFLVFQAVYAAGKPMTDLIGDGFGWMGDHAAACCRSDRCKSLSSTACSAALVR
jgi:ferrous iron transport protein B